MYSKIQFALNDQNAGVFAEICRKNGMTHCWLQWKYEMAVLSEANSPFTVDTKSDSLCSLKTGVNRVVFTIDFDHDNPNVINYVKFSEVYESTRKYFVVTQTSVDHVHEDNACPLWLEIPQSALLEDISAVVNLWKVQLCCNEWQNFLPANPATQLEKSHRLVSEGNAAWLKKQLIRREGLLTEKDMELAARNEDVESLSMQIDELNMQLAEAEQELEKTRSLSLATPKKRKTAKASSGARKAPRTAPAKSSATFAGQGEIVEPETPTKGPRFAVKGVTPDDPFVVE
ncbi:hypothetical protein DHEL01_v204453 [Diaporthe helianthi]|uniref:Uncharacterized protein n=1 Tax=Diaporthe helianthi TaxID=158607 RepID=A0A2P5I3V4_DIAHE|nr:hypothetical protein DHEL01_v204453 [Diaporthe helianthi]